jgi:hypothetical protein
VPLLAIAAGPLLRRALLLAALAGTLAACGGGGSHTAITPPCSGGCCPPLECCSTCSPLDAGTAEDATATYPVFGWVPFLGVDGRADGTLDDSSSTDGMPDSDAACTPLATPVHCVQGHCVDEPPVACVDGGWFCLTASATCYEDGGAAD